MRTYTLQHDGLRFWTGAIPDGVQVLLGNAIPALVLYRFSADGRYLTKEMLPLLTPTLWDSQENVYLTGGPFMEALQQEILRHVDRLRVSPGPISIEAFFDDEEGIGVKELPSEFEE